MKWSNPNVNPDARADLQSARARKQQQLEDAIRIAEAMLLRGKRPYRDTVSDEVRARRRAKNKAARASRKANR